MKIKKPQLDLRTILTGVALLLGVASVLLLLAPAIKSSVTALGQTATKTYTGFQVAFGYTDKSTVLGHEVSTKVLVASAYILPIIVAALGVVVGIVAFLGICDKYTALAAAALLIVAGVLYFLPTVMANPYTGDLTGDNKAEAVKAFKDTLSLGAGSIVAGILAILGGIAAAVPPVLGFVKK